MQSVTLSADELADAIRAFESAYDALMKAHFGSLREWSAAAEAYRKACRRKSELEKAIGWERNVS